ncbi:cyclic pyranopterin monophosphate synthase MoaC, partial [Neisseria sp. P0001.S009]|uniref:cyclic pyranopterin monophosphate synthase MoaC n=1 Tax=Neisseria sp. P0001.S009 TaxID=3436653 RepID=UPI003F7F81D1
LIPLQLPGRIIGVEVDFDINVEMAFLKATLSVQENSNGSIATEALTGLNLELLSVYDMMKDVYRNMMLSGIRIESETSN